MKINLDTIKEALKDYEEVHVDTFIQYLKFLQTDKNNKGELKNKWILYAENKPIIHLFKKVRDEGLNIDGDTVTLQFKGKLMVSLSYQAYKNLVLKKYPETIFDMQLVREGDEFNLKKESGRIIYDHTINSAFNDSKIIGAYCIIKNKNGEFIETISLAELEKIRKTAKTDFIWAQWTSEMYLKTVIKRACKRHFKDLVISVEKLDNENHDLKKLEKRKDKSVEFFKKLVEDMPDAENLIKEFEEIEDIDKRTVRYRQMQKEVKKINELKEEIKNEN
jgi:recombinational DNA repair protein RecT